MKTFDINSDLGEGTGIEVDILPLLNSCNIACGGHAGDSEEIKRVVDLAIQNKVRIGAHPSYPDRDNFGRKPMNLNPSALFDSIYEQIERLLKVTGSQLLHHIKPHGALYHQCNSDPQTAQILLDVIHKLCPEVVLFVLPRSQMSKQALQSGIRVWYEGFIDRRYQENGQLLPRTEQGSVLEKKEDLFKQFYNLVHKQEVITKKGNRLQFQFDTLCIHGDHPNAVTHLKYILDRYNTIAIT
jgi:UPF0271 protein